MVDNSKNDIGLVKVTVSQGTGVSYCCLHCGTRQRQIIATGRNFVICTKCRWTTDIDRQVLTFNQQNADLYK